MRSLGEGVRGGGSSTFGNRLLMGSTELTRRFKDSGKTLQWRRGAGKGVHREGVHQSLFAVCFLRGRDWRAEDAVVRFLFSRIYYRIKMKFICEVSHAEAKKVFLAGMRQLDSARRPCKWKRIEWCVLNVVCACLSFLMNGDEMLVKISLFYVGLPGGRGFD